MLLVYLNCYLLICSICIFFHAFIIQYAEGRVVITSTVKSLHKKYQT